MAKKPRYSPKEAHRTIVYGAFKGMGDLLCAAPVIACELSKGHIIKLLLFPGSALSGFVKLLDFGQNSHNLSSFQLPVSGGLTKRLSFLRQMASFQADLVWISPHASREASSWKIPLLLWLVKKLCWPSAVLAGAWNERLSTLFDIRVPLDRSLSLALREWVAYSQVADGFGQFPGFVPFIESITIHKKSPPTYDLLIAPGANAANRLWPLPHYVSLVQMIPLEYRIAVVGLPSDIEKMRQVLPKNRRIELLTGTLEEAISLIAQSGVLLSMDSGNAHFANALNTPGIALFGKADPASIIPETGTMRPFYEKRFPCQPCNRAHCSQPQVYCMDSIAPEAVAKALVRLLQNTSPVIR
jgi:ADP-heptose:LPS heptosyltransferase